jgi:PhnB protein
MTAHKPTTIMPFLTVSNCKKAVDFYISALGAIEKSRYENTDKKLMANIDIEGAEFWVGDEEAQFGNVSPDLNGNRSVRIILATNNADDIFEKAVKSGAIQICPMTTEKVWRIGILKDPFGHVWEIGYIL